MEEPGRLQSMGLLRVGHDWATSLSLFTFMHWRRKWQPTPVLLPGESQGRGSLVGCCLWGRTEPDMTKWLSSSSRELNRAEFHRYTSVRWGTDAAQLVYIHVIFPQVLIDLFVVIWVFSFCRSCLLETRRILNMKPLRANFSRAGGFTILAYPDT